MTADKDLVKRLRILGHVSDYAICDKAADALEAAERVIAPFARLHDEVISSGGRPVPNLAAARDWLARHATGQRKGGDDDHRG